MEKKDKAFTGMIKPRKKYGMVQIPVESYEMLKEYANHHGFMIGGLLSSIIKQYIKKPRG
jgi:hypothetical protein